MRKFPFSLAVIVLLFTVFGGVYAQQNGLLLRFQNGGSNLTTRAGGLVTLNAGTNMTASLSGSTITLAATGGGGASTYYCPDVAGNNATAYVCTASPTLSAYSAGIVVQFIPTIACGGGSTTVNMSGLGAKNIKMADGVTNPTSLSCASGVAQLLSYDGAVFRLPPASAGFGSAYATGSVLYTNAAFQAAAICAEATLAASVPGTFVPKDIILRETTQFTFGTITSLTASAGRASTDTDLLPQFSLGTAGGQNFYATHPAPPIMGASNTYSIVVQLCADSGHNIGTGAATRLTAGQIDYVITGSFAGQ